MGGRHGGWGGISERVKNPLHFNENLESSINKEMNIVHMEKNRKISNSSYQGLDEIQQESFYQ